MSIFSPKFSARHYQKNHHLNALKKMRDEQALSLEIKKGGKVNNQRRTKKVQLHQFLFLFHLLFFFSNKPTINFSSISQAPFLHETKSQNPRGGGRKKRGKKDNGGVGEGGIVRSLRTQPK